jgi:hypothetical protein
MTSFMGPMAPPPAAPAQPQALDIRTDPNRRQQFKQFMKQRTSMAPMTSAPIAQPPMPMMQPPMSMPMGQDIDIFNPVNLHEGGIVPSLNSLQQQASQFAEQLQGTVMGGGQGGGMGGGGFGGSFSSGASTSEPLRSVGQSNIQKEMSSDSPYFNVPALPTQQAVVNPQVDPNPFFGGSSPQRNLFSGTVEPQSYGLAGMGSMLGFNDGGAVPPRRTDIRGQDHMLSYITPDEADILKALGGSGEAGPMGIPAYIGDNEGGQSSSGASEGDVGGPGAGAGDNDDGGFAGDDTGQESSSGSYGGGSSDTSNSDADEVSDAIADIAAAEKAGQEADARAAARDKAVRDAFVTNSKNEPVQTRSGFLGKASATDDQKAAGYKALGLPDPNSDKASQDVEDSYGVPVGIASVSGVPTDPLSSSNKGLLLGLNPQDLLAIENFSYAPPAQTNVSLSRNPSSFTGKVSAPIGLQDIQAIDELSFGPPASIDPVSAPSSNALGQLSAEQLAAMDLNTPSMVDAETDVMARDLSDMNRAGYSRGLPTGLEFGTNLSTGTDFTTNLAGTTEAQRAEMPGYLDNLAKDSKLTGFLAQNPYGYEIDPVTGKVTGTVGAPSRIGMVGNLLAGLQNLTMGPPVDSRDLVERGVYSGYGAGYDALGESGGEGGDGPDQTVKPPTDPCPDGFVMKNGACTPIETDTGSDFPNQIGGMTPGYNAPPVIVPSSRFQGYSLQGPVGYGSPIAGQAAPSVATNAAMYQQMLQGMRPPLRLEDGGAVPPRNVEISGQDHMLSYITPDEADILKALGGSGNPGPMGIPSFEDGDGGPPIEATHYFAQDPREPDNMIRVRVGSAQDTYDNRARSGYNEETHDLAFKRNPLQSMGKPIPPLSEQFGSYVEVPASSSSVAPDPVVGPVVPDPVVEDPVVPVDPNAYNPIMDVVVPSTRLQDFPASAPPSVIGQPVPMPLQGPVGYGSPEVGQMSPSVVSNAAMYQDMLSQPFPLNFQQGGAVSSNLDMAADNFLKALMPAA